MMRLPSPIEISQMLEDDIESLNDLRIIDIVISDIIAGYDNFEDAYYDEREYIDDLLDRRLRVMKGE